MLAQFSWAAWLDSEHYIFVFPLRQVFCRLAASWVRVMRRKFSAQIWLLMSSLAMINKNTLYTRAWSQTRGQRARIFAYHAASNQSDFVDLCFYLCATFCFCSPFICWLLSVLWKTRPRRHFLLYLYSLSEKRCIHWKLAAAGFMRLLLERKTLLRKPQVFVWFIALNALQFAVIRKKHVSKNQTFSVCIRVHQDFL